MLFSHVTALLREFDYGLRTLDFDFGLRLVNKKD